MVCHVGVLSGFAAVFIYSFSFMIGPLQLQFGWSSEQIARAFSIAAMSVAIFSPFIGRLFDRFDPRKLIACFMVLFGFGIGSLAFLTPHLAQLYGTAALLGIAGTGTYQLGYARIVTAWFDKRLGAALAIVVAGSGVGSFLVPLLVQPVLAAYGWRAAYAVLAALPLFIGAPLTYFFARLPQAAPGARLAPADNPSRRMGSTWPQAMMSFSFWLLAFGVCALSLIENGALAHLAPILRDHGLRPGNVALTASLLGVSSLAGRFVLGSLLDYVEGSLIAMASLLAGGAGIWLLVHAQSFTVAAPAAFIAGLGAGCELDLIPYMLHRYFGARSFATLYGFVYSAFAASGAVAPLLVGRAYDTTGSFTGIFNIFCPIALIAACAMLALPSYRAAARRQDLNSSTALPLEPLLAAEARSPGRIVP